MIILYVAQAIVVILVYDFEGDYHMKITIKTAVLIIICVLATSCVGVMVESNKAHEYNQLEDKIFILIDIGTLDPYLASSLEKKIQEEFTNLGMYPRVVRLSGLELDENKVKTHISNFSPRYVMSIALAEGTVRSSTSYVQGSVMTSNYVIKIYDVKVTDYSAERTIWRAKLRASSNAMWFDSGLTASKLVDGIIDKMVEDGLVNRPEL